MMDEDLKKELDKIRTMHFMIVIMNIIMWCILVLMINNL